MDSILVISIIVFIDLNLFCLSVAIDQHWIFDCSCLFPLFLHFTFAVV